MRIHLVTAAAVMCCLTTAATAQSVPWNITVPHRYTYPAEAYGTSAGGPLVYAYRQGFAFADPFRLHAFDTSNGSLVSVTNYTAGANSVPMIVDGALYVMEYDLKLRKMTLAPNGDTNFTAAEQHRWSDGSFTACSRRLRPLFYRGMAFTSCEDYSAFSGFGALRLRAQNLSLSNARTAANRSAWTTTNSLSATDSRGPFFTIHVERLSAATPLGVVIGSHGPLVAFNAATGAKLWTTPVLVNVSEQRDAGTAVAADGSMLYIVSEVMNTVLLRLFAVNVSTGAVAWTRDVTCVNRTNTTWGSVAVTPDTVVVACSARASYTWNAPTFSNPSVVGFSLAGAQTWSVAGMTLGAVSAEPGARTVSLCSSLHTEHACRGLNPATGATVWTQGSPAGTIVPVPGNPNAIIVSSTSIAEMALIDFSGEHRAGESNNVTCTAPTTAAYRINVCSGYTACTSALCTCVGSSGSSDSCLATATTTCSVLRGCVSEYFWCLDALASSARLTTSDSCNAWAVTNHAQQLSAAANGYNNSLLAQSCAARACALLMLPTPAGYCTLGVNYSTVCRPRPTPAATFPVVASAGPTTTTTAAPTVAVGTQSTTGPASSTSTAAPTARVAFHAQFSLGGNWTAALAASRPQLAAALRDDISRFLAIAASFVNVTDLRLGSLVVNFAVAEGSNADVQTMQTRVQNATSDSTWLTATTAVSVASGGPTTLVVTSATVTTTTTAAPSGAAGNTTSSAAGTACTAVAVVLAVCLLV